MSSWIIVVDTPSIHNFVFSPEKLADIVSSSAMVEDFNFTEMEKVLSAAVNGRVETVYTAGGSGMFIVSGCSEDPGDAVETAFRSAGRAFFAGGILPGIGCAVYDESDFPVSVRAAYSDLGRRRTRSRGTLSRIVSFSPVAGCEFCSDEPATAIEESSGSRIGRVCAARKAYYSGVIRSRKDELEQYGPRRPVTLLDVADPVHEEESAKSRNDIAIIYGDGNSMGRIIKMIKKKEEYAAFSSAVDSGIRDAVRETIKTLVEENPEFRFLPVNPLILGGDDLIVAVKGDLAFRFLELVSGHYTRLSGECLKKNAPGLAGQIQGGLTLSFGVVFMNPSFPVSLALQTAEQLLKNAKRRGVESAGKNPVGAHFDFRILKGSGRSGDPSLKKAGYVRSAGGRTLVLTGRPYPVNSIPELTGLALDLKSLPSNKVHQLYSMHFEGSHERIQLEYLKIYTRLRKNDQQKMHGVMRTLESAAVPPWKDADSNVSSLADLIEMAQYCGKGG